MARALAVSVCLLAATTAATPAAQARKTVRARSSVTIEPYVKGVFGFVNSPDKGRCGSGRRVEVFGQRDDRGDASGYTLMGTARAHEVRGRLEPERGRLMWQLHGSARRLYAQLAPTPRCASAKSQRITGLSNGKGLRRGADVPACPSKEGFCRLATLHFDTLLCPNFGSVGGDCAGDVLGPIIWQGGGGHFRWWFAYIGNARNVVLNMIRDSSGPQWELRGLISDPASAEWAITDAYNKKGPDPNAHWTTVDNGIPPGEMGGPLYLNFDNGIVGADVYVHGYLYKTNPRMG